MTILNFPASPNAGDEYAENGITYTWTGSYWSTSGNGATSDGTSVEIGPTPPGGSIPGDLWYNTTDGMLYVYYTDVDSSQWVNCSPPSVNGGGNGASVEVGGTPPASPTEGDLWYNTVDGMLYVYYTDANGSQWVDASPGASTTYTGYKNIIMNPNLEINQRNVTIGAAATGQYGPDRWKKTGGSTMTQIVESGNFEPGAVYTLSGTGITTQQITAPASGNWTLPDISTSASKIQLELGSIATAFERRPIGLELSLCQRYYQLVSCINKNVGKTGESQYVSIETFSTPMRVNPTVGQGPGYAERIFAEPTNRYSKGSSNLVVDIDRTLGIDNSGGGPSFVCDGRKQVVFCFHYQGTALNYGAMVYNASMDAEL